MAVCGIVEIPAKRNHCETGCVFMMDKVNNGLCTFWQDGNGWKEILSFYAESQKHEDVNCRFL